MTNDDFLSKVTMDFVTDNSGDFNHDFETVRTPTKEQIQDNIREIIAKERMLRGMVSYFKLDEMLLDVIPDLFVHLMSTPEGLDILNRLDKNGKVTQFISTNKP